MLYFMLYFIFVYLISFVLASSIALGLSSVFFFPSQKESTMASNEEERMTHEKAQAILKAEPGYC
jgi:hypothetical protein